MVMANLFAGPVKARTEGASRMTTGVVMVDVGSGESPLAHRMHSTPSWLGSTLHTSQAAETPPCHCGRAAKCRVAMRNHHRLPTAGEGFEGMG